MVVSLYRSDVFKVVSCILPVFPLEVFALFLPVARHAIFFPMLIRIARLFFFVFLVAGADVFGVKENVV